MDNDALRYVYGPVPSRRLGRSLGVDPVPPKTCNQDCVYCQLGRTRSRTLERQAFFDPHEIVREAREILMREAPTADADVVRAFGAYWLDRESIAVDWGRLWARRISSRMRLRIAFGTFGTTSDHIAVDRRKHI